MDKFGQVHVRELKADHWSSVVKTVYLHDCRVRCANDTEFVIPYAHLNHYNYKSKKGNVKQHVLTQVTLWDPSALLPNMEFQIVRLNDVPVSLRATTDDAGRLTARDNTPDAPQDA